MCNEKEVIHCEVGVGRFACTMFKLFRLVKFIDVKFQIKRL